MARNQNWGSAGPGGFLRILGIIYLIKVIRRRQRRRERRRPGSRGSPRES